jgi:hypothetical protein
VERADQAARWGQARGGRRRGGGGGRRRELLWWRGLNFSFFCAKRKGFKIDIICSFVFINCFVFKFCLQRVGDTHSGYAEAGKREREQKRRKEEEERKDFIFLFPQTPK